MNETLSEGANVIGVILGDGWYCGHVAQDGKFMIWGRISPDGLMSAGTQTACVLALHFDLVTPEQRPVTLDPLVKLIERNNMKDELRGLSLVGRDNAGIVEVTVVFCLASCNVQGCCLSVLKGKQF